MLVIIFLSQIVLYLFLFYNRPTLLFRPTFWVAGITLISISAAAVFYHNPSIQYRYLDEELFRIICLIYPAALMMWIIFTPFLPSINLSKADITFYQHESYSTLIIAVSFSFILIALIALLTVIPYYETGLYANFFDPDNALIFREKTFKLLPSQFVKSLLSHAKAVFIPFAFGFAYLRFRKSKNILTSITLILVMSVSLLVGLGLNYLYGFWQADPIVGLLIVFFLFKEGYETLYEDED